MRRKMEAIRRFFRPPIQSFFLFGPRGTGKSTLVKREFEDALYLDLLDPGVFRTYSARPEHLKERLLAENDGRGVNYAFNCTLPSSEVAYETLKMDGYLMNITGGCKSQSQMEKRIDGSFYYNKEEHEENVQLVVDGKIKLEPVLSHEFPLDQINEAMELRSRHPEKSLKVTIKCD